MDKIAIIVPAYKVTYMQQMLDSLAIQDLTGCHIYIGDDSSPYDLKSIVDNYLDTMPISYHRFEENLGGKDLVAHWMRCVELADNPEWIWLFSDDDVMCPDCVSLVKRALADNHNRYDVYHINGIIVDYELREIGSTPLFPEFINSEEYIKRIILNQDNSWGINYIVKSEKFYKDGGFLNFDLAWNSDRASWLKFATPKGIYTVQDAKVLWRYSGENITSQKKNIPIVRRKAESRAVFVTWLARFMKVNRLRHTSALLDRVIYALRCFKNDAHGGFFLAIKVLIATLKNII